MHAVARYSDYDDFAWFYNEHWGSRCCEQVLPIIEKVVLPRIPNDAHILDVCCGTGQVAYALMRQGYHVSGFDSSSEMIRYASRNAPDGEFFVFDARSFSLPDRYHAVISTSDSLNHILSLDDLRDVFRNVHSVLSDGGLFLFDMNREEGYKLRAHTTASVVRPDHVCVMRADYRPEDKLGLFDITTFRMNERWERADMTLFQRCYSQAAIKRALRDVGFHRIRTFDMKSDFGVEVQIPTTVYLCRKPVSRRGGYLCLSAAHG